MTGAARTALHSRVDGPERAPWIVLSNSLGTDLTMWDAQIPLLTQKYRVLRYDTRGHGRSPVPDAPVSFADFERDVVELMDANGIDRAAFMGLSLGGMTGLGLALNHGERFERIVCCCARADSPPPFLKSWDDRIAAVESSGVAAIAEPTMERWLTREFRHAEPLETNRLRTMFEATPPAGYIACARALKTLHYRRRLGSIALPMLYVAGASDEAAPAAAMREMAGATPGAAYAEIGDAAHIANVNNAEAFNAAIRDFLF